MSAYAQQNRLCGRSGRCFFQAQLIGNRLLDDRTFEEARVVARVQQSHPSPRVMVGLTD